MKVPKTTVNSILKHLRALIASLLNSAHAVRRAHIFSSAIDLEIERSFSVGVSVSNNSYVFRCAPTPSKHSTPLSMFCYESGFENYVPRRAAPDGCNIDDPKTLNNLIRVSKFYEPNPKYLELTQKNSFTIEMRKQLTEWMFEVCR